LGAACTVVAGTVLADASPSSAAAAATTGTARITTIAGGGTTTAITDGVASLSATLGLPLSAVFDSHGNVVFADQNNNVIRVAAASTGTFYGHAMTSGHIYTIVGNGVDGDIGDGSNRPLTTAELSDPNGVAIDSLGDVAITDSGNDAVRFVAAVGGLRYGQEMTAGEIYTIAGGGQEGDITPGGSTFSAGLTSPDGVAFDAQGDVIVADTGNDIIRIIPAVSRTIFGMAVQPGRIYTIAGNTVFGFTGNAGGIPGTSAELSLDTFNGVAVDARGDVAFSDVDNSVVRLVAATAGTYQGRAVKAGDIYTIAGNGIEGLKGTKVAATTVELDTPQGVAFDAAGNLFISDSANNLIRVVVAATGTYDGMPVKEGDIYTVVGTGATGDTGNGGLATAAATHAPAGVRVGTAGRLVIADSGNDGNGLIREITGTLAPPPTVSTVKPASGPTTGDKKVTITGANLSNTTAVYFGARPASNLMVKSDKKVVAYSPAGTVGKVLVRVYSTSGVSVASLAGSYTYTVVAAKKHGHRHKAS
jgi:IPT/TIG domain/NHL repeat